jgi:hypothetical protein
MNCPYCGQLINHREQTDESSDPTECFPVRARVLDFEHLRFQLDPGANNEMKNLIGEYIFVRGPLREAWANYPFYLDKRGFYWPETWLSIVGVGPKASFKARVRKIRPRKAPEDAHA